MDYQDFIEGKRIRVESSGFEASGELNSYLFPFQRDIVKWALRRGKATLFEDCGLGKSIQQLTWGNEVLKRTDKPCLMLAPLAVSKQTQREADKFGVPDVHVVRGQADVKPGINITNYEMLHHFDAAEFDSLILDESSILKSYGGAIRKALQAFADQVPYRLAATATPAPNDLIELANHSEFLGVMSGKEIIALYFTQDGNSTQKWRLMNHAKDEFWRWMGQWSVALRTPSDLGYDDGDFILPPLTIDQITVKSNQALPGMLIPVEAKTMDERRKARRASLPDRVAACAQYVNDKKDDCHLVWCDLNKESEALTKAIDGAVEVRGSDKPEVKEERLLAFANGDIRVLVSKPTIAGHGLNFQHCHHMSFVGLSDSFEQFYQAVRRCYRFGQDNPVDVRVITSQLEGAVVSNIKRKEAQAAVMMDQIVKNMSVYTSVNQSSRQEMVYQPRTPMILPPWLKSYNYAGV